MNAFTASANNVITRCRDATLLNSDIMELQRVAKRLAKLLASGVDVGPRVKIAVLSSFTTDFLVELLTLCLFRRGIAADILKGPYGALATEVLGGGAILAGKPDLTVLLPTHRDLLYAPEPGCSREQAEAAVEREVATWRAIWERLQTPVVQLSFDAPPYRTLGELDGFVPGGKLRHVRLVNLALGDSSPPNVALVDAEALGGRLGEAAWHDPHLYHLCKQPFSGAALPEFADTLAATVAGLLGRSRKVLVFDLDNTLWGGVIGDVGLEGIVLGPETAEGEAFVTVQQYAKALARRGIILAVCSKNDAEIARLPFREHPAMVLREEDIACFIASFDNKATGLRRIAESLNVGLDSLVLVDDSPTERAWVRSALPEVMVIELPKSQSGFCRAIEASKAFPTPRLTAEDLTRGASYRVRAETWSAQQTVDDIDGFLAGLESTAIREPVSSGSLDRIVQLIAKTNQFKMNSTTFCPNEIARDPTCVIALRLVDRLQDYGIVSVAVTGAEPDELVVRNWVMSCRVFSRRLEYVMFDLLQRRAADIGAARISLSYEPSQRNKLVQNVLEELGFAHDDITGRYMAPAVGTKTLPPHHIRIVASEKS